MDNSWILQSTVIYIVWALVDIYDLEILQKLHLCHSYFFSPWIRKSSNQVATMYNKTEVQNLVPMKSWNIISSIKTTCSTMGRNLLTAGDFSFETLVKVWQRVHEFKYGAGHILNIGKKERKRELRSGISLLKKKTKEEKIICLLQDFHMQCHENTEADKSHNWLAIWRWAW